jgi:hypothetical protein
MKKPLNKIAIFVWLVAALNALAQSIFEPFLQWWLMDAVPAYRADNATTHLVFLLTHLANIRIGIVTTTILIALGAIVEFLDQIRWNTDPARK